MSNKKKCSSDEACERCIRVADLLESVGSDYVSVYAVAMALYG